MSDISRIFPLKHAVDRSIERAIDEFRAGRPVVIENKNETILTVGLDMLDDATTFELNRLAGRRTRLVLSPPRLKRLGLICGEPGTTPLPRIDRHMIEDLAFHYPSWSPLRSIDPADRSDCDALELARLSYALPAALVIPMAKGMPENSFARIQGERIRTYRRLCVEELRIVSRVQSPFEHETDIEAVLFRGGEGLRDQIALIVGKPELTKPVAVRLHSACLTGDLFGSLKCDCGDQLRSAIARMRKDDGGIVLYLDQEGRGIGIGEKIRAYRLQTLGFDTYDADEILGFEPDRRRFDFAARMLRLLTVERVKLLTNNPVKIAALCEAGIDVVADERIVGRRTSANVNYIAAKRKKAGHLFETEDSQTQGKAASI